MLRRLLGNAKLHSLGLLSDRAFRDDVVRGLTGKARPRGAFAPLALAALLAPLATFGDLQVGSPLTRIQFGVLTPFELSRLLFAAII